MEKTRKKKKKKENERLCHSVAGEQKTRGVNEREAKREGGKKKKILGEH